MAPNRETMIRHRHSPLRGLLTGMALAAVMFLGASSPAQAQQVTTLGYQMAGGNRTALMVDFSQGRPAPLVIVLHGANGTSEQIRRYLTWDEIAAREKLIIVYPQGVSGSWNDGRPTDGRRFNPVSRVDDVAFIRRVVSELETQARIDRRRVYVVGVSAGGHMAFRLVCEAGEVFAAAAPMLATLSVIWKRSCPGQALPIVMVNGMQDRITPWVGQGGGADPDGALLSAPETFAFLRARNGCSSYGERALPEQSTSGGTRVVIMDGTICRRAVRLYRVEGGGHHTPTRYDRRMRPAIGAMLGQQNHDMEADEEVWVFFSDKTRS